MGGAYQPRIMSRLSITAVHYAYRAMSVHMQRKCRQAYLEELTTRSVQRDAFWNDYQRKEVDFIMNKYGTTPLMTKIKNKLVRLISIGEQDLSPDRIYYSDYSEGRAV